MKRKTKTFYCVRSVAVKENFISVRDLLKEGYCFASLFFLLPNVQATFNEIGDLDDFWVPEAHWEVYLSNKNDPSAISKFPERVIIQRKNLGHISESNHKEKLKTKQRQKRQQ